MALLRVQVGLQSSPERHPRGIGHTLQKGQQQVEHQAHQAAQRHASQEWQIEEAQTFDPDQGHHEGREEANHGPIVGHRNAVSEGRAQQPGFAFFNAELQQAADHVGEEQQIEHLTAGAPGRRGGSSGRGVLPKSQLEAADQRGQNRRQPGGANREKSGSAGFLLALIVGAIMRQQRHRACQQGQR